MRTLRVVQNNKYEDIFDGKLVKLKAKVKDCPNKNETYEDKLEEVERPVVFCNDTKSFIYDIILERGLPIDNSLVKIGIDDEQGILKVNVQVVSKEGQTDEKQTRSKYNEVHFCLNFCCIYIYIIFTIV